MNPSSFPVASFWPARPLGPVSGPSFVLALCLAVLAVSPVGVRAQASYPTRTQTLELKKGWNAVFLEVEPTETAPGTIFAETPVDVVAQFLRPVRTAQFATDPGEVLANRDGWGIWYAPGREEALFSNLFALHSHTALLVHCTDDANVPVTGQVFHKRIHWKPDSYNFVGFPVNSVGAPTFAEYFQGADAHGGKPVYRLVEGKWRKVERPSETLMRRGEAYWVYCAGGSDYQGPLELDLLFGDHLRYVAGQSGVTFHLHNRSPHPVEPTIVQVGDGELRLDFVFKAVMESGIDSLAALLPQSITMAAMEPGVSGSVTLKLHDVGETGSGASNLLRVSSDAGVEYWVAVYAEPTSSGG